ncbi:hypothetical protein B0H15DRAFT_992577, partial [Mycena belliarum]
GKCRLLSASRFLNSSSHSHRSIPAPPTHHHGERLSSNHESVPVHNATHCSNRKHDGSAAMMRERTGKKPAPIPSSGDPNDSKNTRVMMRSVREMEGGTLLVGALHQPSGGFSESVPRSQTIRDRGTVWVEFGYSSASIDTAAERRRLGISISGCRGTETWPGSDRVMEDRTATARNLLIWTKVWAEFGYHRTLHANAQPSEYPQEKDARRLIP